MRRRRGAPASRPVRMKELALRTVDSLVLNAPEIISLGSQQIRRQRFAPAEATNRRLEAERKPMELTEQRVELMSEIMSTEESVPASRKAFETWQLPPRELFASLVRPGWIDARGRVTKILGGSGKPEPTPKTRFSRHAGS